MPLGLSDRNNRPTVDFILYQQLQHLKYNNASKSFQIQQRNPARLLRAQIPRNNVGQVAHVSPTP